MTAYRERVSAVDGGVLWTLSGASGSGRVLPDGCMDLLWFDGDLVIAGPDTVAYATSPNARAVTGLRLAAGIGPTAFGVPAYEVRDLRVPLREVVGGRTADRLVSRIAVAERPGQVLEEIVGERLSDRTPDPLMRHVADLAARGTDVASIGRTVGLSERQLHRRARTSFGYGVKQLSRIHRFQDALALARSGVSLATTAARTGYADQPHLAREARALSGAPMRNLL